MPDVRTLYDADFLAWSKEQAEALRAEAHRRSDQKLDWENLAEEIADLGKSQTAALASQIRRIIEHFSKRDHSPWPRPRHGWRVSIVDARVEIEVLLERNPSLRPELSSIVAEEHPRAARKAIAALEHHGELDPPIAARIRATAYTADQILGDWFPPQPQD